MTEKSISNLFDGGWSSDKRGNLYLDDNKGQLPALDIDLLENLFDKKISTYQGNAMKVCVWVDPRMWAQHDYCKELLEGT